MAIETEVQLLQNRRTRIVATLGPASNELDVIECLIATGVNVFRLNMSHGEHAAHRETYERVRAAAHAAGRTVGVLADLAGPKIRVGQFRDGGIELVQGARVVVTTRAVEGEPGLIPSQYAELSADVAPRDRILLADGTLELEVESVDGPDVTCTVTQGGRLTDRKGINLPGVDVSAPCLTDKDRADARFALELGVDFLAQSFVRRGDDIAQLRELVAAQGARAGLVAKIERPEALQDIDAILDIADALMVARGDLGVELPPEQVPIAQHRLIDAARARGKAVIVATQMLESMIELARPTRAEVSDVSGAVLGGADAVMLSAETAAGAHPLEAVAMMDRIARQAEGYLWQQGAFGRFERASPYHGATLGIGDAVAHATAQLSRDLRVRAIVCLSESGRSAAAVSAARPAAPVICVSSDAATCRRACLMWGVLPHQADPAAFADSVALARALAVELELAAIGHFILLVRGFHADPRRNAPSITVIQV